MCADPWPPWVDMVRFFSLSFFGRRIRKSNPGDNSLRDKQRSIPMSTARALDESPGTTVLYLLGPSLKPHLDLSNGCCDNN